ncbi:hypothetical protein [Nitrospira sp. Nam74]
MPFVHVHNYFINVDHIQYVEETGNDYIVHFGDGKHASVTKSSPAGKNLMQVILTALE